MAIEPTPGPTQGTLQKPVAQASDAPRSKRAETARAEGETSGIRSDTAVAARTRRISPEVVALRRDLAEGSNTASRLQFAESSVAEISQVLSRMKALAREGGDAALDEAARERLEAEFADLRRAANETAEAAVFDGQRILDARSLEALVGAEDLAAAVSLNIASLSPDDLGIDDLSLSSAEAAATAAEVIERASELANAVRDRLDAVLERLLSDQAERRVSLEETLNSEGIGVLNPEEAGEVANLTIRQIIEEMELARLTQAQQNPKDLLQLVT